MSQHENRQVMAEFLRKRRESLTPAEVGLPAGYRRRTPGLRREEVAQLANIGTSWYIWLEQGRDVNPSVAVLESLAHALRLTQNERRHLFLLAGQSLPAPTAPLEEQINPALQQVLNELDPMPAYVLGRRLDYLAWNRAADSVLNISSLGDPYPRNLVWHYFTNPKNEQPDTYREETGRSILAEFRTASARYPVDSWFEQLIDDLKKVSSQFRKWWPHHEVRRTLDGHKKIEHATLGHLEFEHITLQLPSDPDVKIMIYTPNLENRLKLVQYGVGRTFG